MLEGTTSREQEHNQFNFRTSKLCTTEISTTTPTICNIPFVQMLTEVPREDCQMVPVKKCKKINRLVPTMVPTEQCQQVPTEVRALSLSNSDGA